MTDIRNKRARALFKIGILAVTVVLAFSIWEAFKPFLPSPENPWQAMQVYD